MSIDNKKINIIEAIQFIITKEIQCKYGIHYEDNAMDIAEFMGQITHVRTTPNGTPQGRTYIEIPTSEGILELNINDYIIKDMDGNFYPCKPDIFIKTYESIGLDNKYIKHDMINFLILMKGE